MKAQLRVTFFVVNRSNFRNVNQVDDKKEDIVCAQGEGMRGVNLVF
jgi:hypothetical protein